MARVTATRAPAGSTAAANWQHDRLRYQTAPLWPGITWGHDARCLCSWSVRYGVQQVKAASAACPVHLGGREPEPAAPACREQEDEPGGPPETVTVADELLAAIRTGTVTRELYDAFTEPPLVLLGRMIALVAGVAEAGDPWLADRCGTSAGVKRHYRENTRTCPKCRAYERDRIQARRKSTGHREAETWPEAA